MLLPCLIAQHQAVLRKWAMSSGLPFSSSGEHSIRHTAPSQESLAWLLTDDATHICVIAHQSLLTVLYHPGLLVLLQHSPRFSWRHYLVLLLVAACVYFITYICNA